MNQDLLAAVEDLAPSYDHLLRLADDTGVLEHAAHGLPRREHGYCLDDTARALVVILREPEPAPELVDLATTCLSFIRFAMDHGGTFHNRMSFDRRWTDEPSVGDHWGRAVWALGCATAAAASDLRGPAAEDFRTAAAQRTHHPMSMAYAALGAAEVAAIEPGHQAARELLEAAIATIDPSPASTAAWPWPRERLTYGNARIPEALLVAGVALGRDEVIARALGLLRWLLEVETRDGHLSPTPAGGWGPDEPRPGFDQQPIEAWALADACARAFGVTGEVQWRDGVRLAAGWFLGENDLGIPMLQAESGGCSDGLTPTGPNANQGAESTLALLATAQHVQRLLVP